MKNKIVLGFMAAATVLIVSCASTSASSASRPWQNKMYYDSNYFDTAIIDLHNEVITVEVESWTDFEDGEQLQIKAKDGTVYLTSSYNCTLIQHNNQ